MLYVMTSLSYSSQSTRPTVLCEELLVLTRFHSHLRADEWSFCPLVLIWIQIVCKGMIVLLKESFEKANLEKSQQTTLA